MSNLRSEADLVQASNLVRLVPQANISCMLANIGLVRWAETPYLTPNSSSDLPRRAFFLALAFGPLWPMGAADRYAVARCSSYESP